MLGDADVLQKLQLQDSEQNRPSIGPGFRVHALTHGRCHATKLTPMDVEPLARR